MADESFRDFVLDQLRELGPVECRRMFGSYGLYHQGVFFAIISKGRLYFKTDEASRAEYELRDMAPFRPSDKQTLKSYFEVPAEIVEDDEQLADWARRALAC